MLDDCHESFKIIYPAHGFSIFSRNSRETIANPNNCNAVRGLISPRRNPERATSSKEIVMRAPAPTVLVVGATGRFAGLVVPELI
ncbi:MAG: hypothetical protein E5W01_20255, partial [Mesorhizobium sp.]